MNARLPNFLHLGPGKTGSTWLHEVLIRHPEAYLSEAKDLYFFSRYYDRGLDWYRAQFRAAGPEYAVIGEISPDYLACEQAPERIRDCLGSDTRLMVTLREPAERAFSSYLYLQRHGLAAPSFRATMQASPELLEEGRYATQLRRYLRHFGPESFHIGVFDDFEANPQLFLNGVTDWLGLAAMQVPPALLDSRLPASKARWLPLAMVAKQTAGWVRQHDGADLVGRVKRSALVQRALYAPLGEDKPVMSPEDVTFVHEHLETEVVQVEEEFGIPLRKRWGWS